MPNYLQFVTAGSQHALPLAIVTLLSLMPVTDAVAEHRTYVTSHHVVLWFHHSKIVMVYDDPVECPGCPSQPIEDATEGCLVACYKDDDASCDRMQYCTTIGSGPADGDDRPWMLGEFNRHHDVHDELTSRPSRIPEAQNAQVVDKLVDALQAHDEEWTCLGNTDRKDERLDYDLLPELADGYNSNSFIAGILRVAGIDPYTVKPNRNTPGFRKHVKTERFSLENPGECR